MHAVPKQSLKHRIYQRFQLSFLSNIEYFFTFNILLLFYYLKNSIMDGFYLHFNALEISSRRPKITIGFQELKSCRRILKIRLLSGNGFYNVKSTGRSCTARHYHFLLLLLGSCMRAGIMTRIIIKKRENVKIIRYTDHNNIPLDMWTRKASCFLRLF